MGKACKGGLAAGFSVILFSLSLTNEETKVTERRQPLSSVSSLEVHFDLLDLTELTDMSDQELAEVFADSDDENLATESPAGEAARWLEGKKA